MEIAITKRPNPKSYSVGTQHVIVRAESADTNGVCSVLEMHHPPGTGAPLHYHLNEDEGFFVLAGSYRFFVGDQERSVSAGDFVMAAKGVAHSFRSVGPELGKLLVYFTPGGVERYFEKMGAIPMNDLERGAKCTALDREFGIVMGNP